VRCTGTSFAIDRDWLTYRDAARRFTEFQRLSEPDPIAARVVVSDAGPDLDWADRDAAGRWLAWLDYTRELRRTLSTAFRELTGDAFAFEERGAVEIRGIGETRTHFLTSAR